MKKLSFSLIHWQKILLFAAVFFMLGVCHAQEDNVIINYQNANGTCADGCIDISIVGGYKPYKVIWTDHQTEEKFVLENLSGNDGTEDLCNIPSGWYTLTVHDDHCGQLSAILFLPANELHEELIEVVSMHEVSKCTPAPAIEACDGSIEIAVDYPNGEYTVKWTASLNEGEFSAEGEKLSDLCVGIYTAKVYNENDCLIGTTTVTLCCCSGYLPYAPYCGSVADAETPIAISSNPQINNPSSPDAADGSISVQVYNPDKVPLTYTWTGPNGYFYSSDLPYINDVSFGGSYYTEYCVTVSSACQEVTECYLLVDCSAVEFTVAADVTNTCTPIYNEETYDYMEEIPWVSGSIIFNPIDISGGEPPYTFYWTHNGSNTTNLTGLWPGTYCLAITDFNGCSNSVCFEIVEEGPGTTFNCVDYYCNNATQEVQPYGMTLEFPPRFFLGCQEDGFQTLNAYYCSTCFFCGKEMSEDLIFIYSGHISYYYIPELDVSYIINVSNGGTAVDDDNVGNNCLYSIYNPCNNDENVGSFMVKDLTCEQVLSFPFGDYGVREKELDIIKKDDIVKGNIDFLLGTPETQEIYECDAPEPYYNAVLYQKLENYVGLLDKEILEADDLGIDCPYDCGICSGKKSPEIEAIAKKQHQINFYPNLTNESIYADMQLATDAQLHIRLYNATGILIWEQHYQKSAGNSRERINISTIPAGIYYISTYINNTPYAMQKVLKY
ncbi:MAG: T9SS type A sorting domain-containing protein [Bacteroidetes bacterium]|nr:T9SS type A sorting domain-containing protein [Bacteroidota bacterium]MCB9042365.1 T9SS type A sorting domain-containing protein [Chitinophagales bacterium]